MPDNCSVLALAFFAAATNVEMNLFVTMNMPVLLTLATLGNATQIGSFLYVLHPQGSQAFRYL
jgi:hypothetical protein